MTIRISDEVRQYALEKGVQTDLEQLDVDQDGEVTRADIDAAVSTYDTVKRDGKLVGDEQAAMQAAFQTPALARNSIRANAAMTARQSTGQLRDQLLVEVNDWARRAGDQISDHHMASLTAAQRFVDFIGDSEAAKQNQPVVGGSLVWALSINVPTNLAAVMIPQMMNASSDSDTVGMQARLTAGFEASLRERRGEVDAVRNELTAQIRQAAIAGDLDRLRELQASMETDLQLPDDVPSANEQLRDLVVAYAEQEGLQLYGGPEVEAILGDYYVGYRAFLDDILMPVEGIDAAQFLNDLLADEPESNRPAQVNMTPEHAVETATAVRNYRRARGD